MESLRKESFDPNVQRRGVLKMLGAIALTPTIATALEKPASAEESSESFEDWRSEMMSAEGSKYLRYEDVLIGEHDSIRYRPRGVAHTAETLLQNLGTIEADIENSDSVMLEYFDSREMDNLHHEMTAAMIASSEGDLRSSVENTTFIHKDEWSSCFFGAIAGMAARKGKEIIVVNPQTDKSKELTSGNSSYFGASVASLAGLGAIGLAHLLEQRKNNFTIDNNEGYDGVTRRGFVKGAAATTLGMGVLYSTGKQQYLDHQEKKHQSLRVEELELIESDLEQLENAGLVYPSDSLALKVEKLSHCQMDWRDAVTACSILQIAKSAESRGTEETITHFEGALHHGVQEYLAHPEMAKDRVQLYENTFNRTGIMSIRRFRWNQDKGAFDILKEAPLDR